MGFDVEEEAFFFGSSFLPVWWSGYPPCRYLNSERGFEGKLFGNEEQAKNKNTKTDDSILKISGLRGALAVCPQNSRMAQKLPWGYQVPITQFDPHTYVSYLFFFIMSNHLYYPTFLRKKETTSKKGKRIWNMEDRSYIVYSPTYIYVIWLD